MATSVKHSQVTTNAKAHNPHTVTPLAGTGASVSAVMEVNSETGTKTPNHSKKIYIYARGTPSPSSPQKHLTSWTSHCRIIG